jgi:hypothetical protein
MAQQIADVGDRTGQRLKQVSHLQWMRRRRPEQRTRFWRGYPPLRRRQSAPHHIIPRFSLRLDERRWPPARELNLDPNGQPLDTA